MVNKLIILFLDLLAVSDVNGKADITHEFAVRDIPRHAPVENPTVLPIVPARPVLHLEPLPCIKAGVIDLKTVLRILPMHAFRPTVSEFLLQSAPGEVQPTLVDEVAELVRVRRPD